MVSAAGWTAKIETLEILELENSEKFFEEGIMVVTLVHNGTMHQYTQLGKTV